MIFDLDARLQRSCDNLALIDLQTSLSTLPKFPSLQYTGMSESDCYAAKYVEDSSKQEQIRKALEHQIQQTRQSVRVAYPLYEVFQNDKNPVYLQKSAPLSKDRTTIVQDFPEEVSFGLLATSQV